MGKQTASHGVTLFHPDFLSAYVTKSSWRTYSFENILGNEQMLGGLFSFPIHKMWILLHCAWNTCERLLVALPLFKAAQIWVLAEWGCYGSPAPCFRWRVSAAVALLLAIRWWWKPVEGAHCKHVSDHGCCHYILAFPWRRTAWRGQVKFWHFFTGWSVVCHRSSPYLE